MSHTLRQIAEQLRAANKKVQLIYAFNGNGKTRLSRDFKELVSPKPDPDSEADEKYESKVLYYNAFTEDLFYWDNDLHGDAARKLIIQPNSYTEWALKDQGQELNATKHFQRYTNSKLTPLSALSLKKFVLPWRTEIKKPYKISKYLKARKVILFGAFFIA